MFDRLYEDWATIDGFQRTRGVLKLMAKVIYRLWKDANPDLLIMPGSMPLYDGSTRNELTYLLSPGWDSVIEKDIDGDRAETTEIETKEPRFGTINAARRVARTIFLGSAPASGTTKTGNRGISRPRILLGCLQPNQTASIYADALSRLADRLHYLNASGDKTQDTTAFWFDTRANLRREMEERKKRFDESTDVRAKMGSVLQKITNGITFFDGLHIFTAHADVPDDSALRLVIFAPEYFYARDESRPANDAVMDYVRMNGTKPRYRANRLLFLAPDHGALSRLRDAIRTALAWGSIVADVKDGRLNIDQLQRQQAEKELHTAEEVLPRAARECYRWLLCPTQHTPISAQLEVEGFSLSTSGVSIAHEIERICRENELIISAWSPIHLQARLSNLYWKGGKTAVGAMAFWEDTLRYLYLPRLKTRSVLEQAIMAGAGSRDFFGIAYGQTGETYQGFNFGGAHVQLDNTLLLIEPSAAALYEESMRDAVSSSPDLTAPNDQWSGVDEPRPTPLTNVKPTISQATLHTFLGTVDVKAETAKIRMVEIVDEIISLLTSDPQAEVHISVEITAEFPDGVSDHIRRSISENAANLGFKNNIWE